MGSNEVWLGTLSLTGLRTLATMGRSTDMACHWTDAKADSTQSEVCRLLLYRRAEPRR
jgi:hypothetical protein